MDDNTVELIGVGGVLQVGSKIQTDPKDYTIILESMKNETDLTSIPVEQEKSYILIVLIALESNTVLIQVTSEWSAFGQFNTSS